MGILCFIRRNKKNERGQAEYRSLKWDMGCFLASWYLGYEFGIWKCAYLIICASFESYENLLVCYLAAINKLACKTHQLLYY